MSGGGMTAAPRLAVLTHLRQGLDDGYFLAGMIRGWWRPAGIEVLLHQGTAAPPPADLAVLHVDLTRVPAAYLALAAGYPRCLNGRVGDISKRRVSAARLAEGDDYDGPVIVKSDLNHGGASERALRRAAAGGWRAALDRLAERLPLPWRGPAQGRYRVFERREQLPAWVWRRPELIVEPLYVERRDGLFALNQWYCLGEAEIVSTLLASGPLVKIANVVRRLPLHREVPEALRARRAELGIDYAKIDYIVQDGRPRVIDVNTAPHMGPDRLEHPRMAEVCATLAAGLEGFFSGPAAG